jgi:hypothetical protein
MIHGRTLLHALFSQTDNSGLTPDPSRFTNPSGNAGYSIGCANNEALQLTTGTVNTNACNIFVTQQRWPSNIGCLVLWSSPSLGNLTWLLGLRATTTTLTSQSNPTDFYALKPFSNSTVNSGAPSFELWKVINSSAATMASQPAITNYSDGTHYWLRFEIVGSVLTGKLWAASSPESSAQVITVSDTSFTAGGYSTITARNFVAAPKSVDIYEYVLYEPNTLRTPAATILNIIDPQEYAPYPRTVTLSKKT